MSIAQRFVAGEEDVYPSTTPTTTATPSEDQRALAEFRSDSTNLPWVIFRAAFRASHVDGLPQRARAVLAALARTVDASRPYASVFASRDLLTGRAMQSMRTFYRSLADLEAAGLIRRPPQHRYVEAGLFGRAYLHLTEKAARLLGFVEEKSSQPDSDTSVQLPSKSPKSVAESQSPPSDTLAHGTIYKYLSPVSNQKRQPGQLPSDLQRLLSLGFRQFLIFRLMREAREQGKFLSDVVDVTWQHLKQAHAPINYLRSLIQSPTDFSYQARTRREAKELSSRIECEMMDVRSTMGECAGKIFFDRKQRRIEISQDTQLMTIHDWNEANPRVAGGLWQTSFIKALRTGAVRIASAQDEEDFASRLNGSVNKVEPSMPTDVHNVISTQMAVHEAQMKLKQLLRNSRMSRPLASVIQ